MTAAGCRRQKHEECVLTHACVFVAHCCTPLPLCCSAVLKAACQQRGRAGTPTLLGWTFSCCSHTFSCLSLALRLGILLQCAGFSCRPSACAEVCWAVLGCVLACAGPCWAVLGQRPSTAKSSCSCPRCQHKNLWLLSQKASHAPCVPCRTSGMSLQDSCCRSARAAVCCAVLA